jgi:photosystem II stability/assembly factor-like uncharacterized protein
MYKRILTILSLLISISAFAQSPEILYQDGKNSFRGLSMVSDDLIWVSGTRGTVGCTQDGGKTWRWTPIPGYEKRDLRAIVGFDALRAVVIAIDSPAHILRTDDGGAHWTLVYQDARPGMFLDALDFRNEQEGMVVGDPLNGQVFLARTRDNGKTWIPLDSLARPAVNPGEAFFAASASNIISLPHDRYLLVSGGKSSRFFNGTRFESLPLLQGKESTGANGIAAYPLDKKGKNPRYLVIAGGDFAADTLRTGNLVYSVDGGKHWQTPQTPPRGYRSGVSAVDAKRWLVCGTSGIDWSLDGGKNWQFLAKESYHVCRTRPGARYIYLAGSKGKIARYAIAELPGKSSTHRTN